MSIKLAAKIVVSPMFAMGALWMAAGVLGIGILPEDMGVKV